MQPYGFTGRRKDNESGLWYFRNRYYDDRQGRFLSRDPKGYVDGYSMYAGYFAPMGMDPWGLDDVKKDSSGNVIWQTDGGKKYNLSEMFPGREFSNDTVYIMDNYASNIHLDEIKNIVHKDAMNHIYNVSSVDVGTIDERKQNAWKMGGAYHRAWKRKGVTRYAEAEQYMENYVNYLFALANPPDNGLVDCHAGPNVNDEVAGDYYRDINTAFDNHRIDTPYTHEFKYDTKVDIWDLQADVLEHFKDQLEGRLTGGLLDAAGDLAKALRKRASSSSTACNAAGSTPPKGPYRHSGGHHIHAKAGFKHHPTYNPRSGFSISQDFMKQFGLDHDAMTKKQRELFKELLDSGRANTIHEHSRIAFEALKAGGADDNMAFGLVAESIYNLWEQGALDPSHIPWSK